MALAIGVVEGGVIHVGQEKLTVLKVNGLEVQVRLFEKEGGDIWLNDQERQQLWPEVFVSTSRSKNQDGRIRLVLEAPQHIRILRGDHAAAG